MTRPVAVIATIEAPLMKSRRAIMVSSRFGALNFALSWRVDRPHYRPKARVAHQSLSGPCWLATPPAQPRAPALAPHAHVLDRPQHRGRDDQREHGREAEPEHDRGGEMDPPLRGRRADHDLARDELDIDPERYRQYPEDRGHR